MTVVFVAVDFAIVAVDSAVAAVVAAAVAVDFCCYCCQSLTCNYSSIIVLEKPTTFLFALV